MGADRRGVKGQSERIIRWHETSRIAVAHSMVLWCCVAIPLARIPSNLMWAAAFFSASRYLIFLPLLHTPLSPIPNHHPLRALANLLPSQFPPTRLLGATIYVQTQPANHCVPQPRAKPTHVTLHRLFTSCLCAPR